MLNYLKDKEAMKQISAWCDEIKSNRVTVTENERLSNSDVIAFV